MMLDCHWCRYVILLFTLHKVIFDEYLSSEHAETRANAFVFLLNIAIHSSLLEQSTSVQQLAERNDPFSNESIQSPQAARRLVRCNDDLIRKVCSNISYAELQLRRMLLDLLHKGEKDEHVLLSAFDTLLFMITRDGKISTFVAI